MGTWWRSFNIDFARNLIEASNPTTMPKLLEPYGSILGDMGDKSHTVTPIYDNTKRRIPQVHSKTPSFNNNYDRML